MSDNSYTVISPIDTDKSMLTIITSSNMDSRNETWVYEKIVTVCAKQDVSFKKNA